VFHNYRRIAFPTRRSSDHTIPTFQPSGINPWNAGWYVFRPSEETFQAIKAQSETYRSPIYYGDQVVVNDYFNRQRPEIVNQVDRSEEHTSELQSRENLVCR